MLIFVDIETTGLDEKKDSILELGIIVTDVDLKEIVRRSWVCRWLGERDRLHEVVRTMHEKSGLLDECERALTTTKEVEEEAVRFVSSLDWSATNVGGPSVAERAEAWGKQPPLCGSSVHFDRRFLAVQMPILLGLFSYRNIDVSTLTELARRWLPAVYEARKELPAEQKPHRALEDLDYSIGLLRYYRETMLRLPDRLIVSTDTNP